MSELIEHVFITSRHANTIQYTFNDETFESEIFVYNEGLNLVTVNRDLWRRMQVALQPLPNERTCQLSWGK